MTSETNKEITPQKDGLALVVGGLFILALVFAAYNYFSKGTNTEDTTVTNSESAQEVVVQKDKVAADKKEDKSTGSINGDGAKDVKNNGAVAVNKDNTVNSTNTPTNSSTWKANDYKLGDIKGANYTVKSGDTLWEIAEGVYGNGASWTKILEANKGSIKFLPNGNQALIVTGQVLVLP